MTVESRHMRIPIAGAARLLARLTSTMLMMAMFIVSAVNGNLHDNVGHPGGGLMVELVRLGGETFDVLRLLFEDSRCVRHGITVALLLVTSVVATEVRAAIQCGAPVHDGGAGTRNT